MLSSRDSTAELLAAFWITISATRQPARLAVGRLSAADADCSALQKHDDTQLLGMQLAVRAYRSAVISAALAGGVVPGGNLHGCHGSAPPPPPPPPPM